MVNPTYLQGFVGRLLVLVDGVTVEEGVEDGLVDGHILLLHMLQDSGGSGYIALHTV